MGINFKVSMILEASNRMDGGIGKALQSTNKLKRSFISTTQETAKLNPVSGWADKISAVTRKMDEFGKKAQSIRDKAEKQIMSGMAGMASGGAITAPVLDSIKQAADLQTRFTTMKVMGLSTEGEEKIRTQSIQLSKGLSFSLKQTVGVAQALQKAGMNESKILQSQRIATNYAQLEYNRYGVDPNQTATHLAHIAESSGVLYASKEERDKYGLNTQADIDQYIVGKFGKMAEYLNKVVSVTSSDTATIAESIKYSMPTAKALGWNEESVMLMSGIYSRFGVEGSMSGTHLKDFVSRLNPYQTYFSEDEAKESNRLSAMQEAGWLDGAQWIIGKNGQKKFISAGQSAFHNSDGTLKNPDEIFSKIYEAYQNFETKGERLRFEGILHTILGEQGQDIVQLLNQNPEMFAHIKEDMEKISSMEEGLAKYQEDVNTQWDIFAGNIKTASILFGETVLQDVGSSLKNINETLFGIGDKASPVGTWIIGHQELINLVMKATFAVAGFTAGFGALKIVGAIISFGLISPLATVCGWLMKSKNAIELLSGAYKSARLTGLGFGKSIVKGLTAAWPWFGKLADGAGKFGSVLKGLAARGVLFGLKLAGGAKTALKWLRSLSKIGVGIGKVMGNDSLIAIKAIGSVGKAVGKFTKGWLVNAARIAAGWLIALGPPGWIILGVTALIMAGVAAWKTNFMGFRDKCVSVWNAISDWGSKSWDAICGFVSSAIERVSGYIGQVKEAVGLSHELDGKVYRGDSARVLQYLNPDSGNKSSTVTSNYTFNTNSVDDTLRIADHVGARDYFGADANPAANGW